MTWTRFMDMHSGGGTKEKPYEYIFIEAPESEAKRVFYARFGHNPERISCTCCGEDYSMDESEDFEQATAYERGAVWAYPSETAPERTDGSWRAANESGRYFAPDDVPEGWELSRSASFSHKPYLKPDAYAEKPDVLIVRATEITDEQLMQTFEDAVVAANRPLLVAHSFRCPQYDDESAPCLCKELNPPEARMSDREPPPPPLPSTGVQQ